MAYGIYCQGRDTPQCITQEKVTKKIIGSKGNVKATVLKIDVH